MSIELVVDLIGWLGALGLLLPYFLVSIGKIKGESRAFQVCNLFGSVMLVINSFYYGALPSVAVNIVWIAIGCAMLVKIQKDNRQRGRANESV